MVNNTSWSFAPIPVKNPRLRLICFPYAGGSTTTFKHWSQSLPNDVEVIPIQFPGRANRYSERPIDDMDLLVTSIAESFEGFIDRPYILFGHSLGSRVAYELAKRFQLSGLQMPLHLIASGSRAAHVISDNKSIHALPQEQFIESLRQLNGTPEELLNNQEILELLIPMLRADFKISETHTSQPCLLKCPISVLFGTQDSSVSAEHVNAWNELTSAGFRIRGIDGDHFFVDTNPSAVLSEIISIASMTGGKHGA